MWEYDYLFKQDTIEKNSLPDEWIPRQISHERPISHESRSARLPFAMRFHAKYLSSIANQTVNSPLAMRLILLKISLYVFQLKGKPNLEHLPIIQLLRRPSARRKSTRDVFFSPKQKHRSLQRNLFMGSFNLFSPEILVRKEHLSGIGKLKIILKFKLILL